MRQFALEMRSRGIAVNPSCIWNPKDFLCVSFLSLSLYYYALLSYGALVVRALRTSARIERISERVLVFQAREARFVPYVELFQACMFYCYISNVCVFSKRLLLLLLTYMRIYTKRGGDVARLRGGEKAERSEESALFKLLSGCFCFVFFSLVRCCCCSHLSLRSTTTTYFLHLCSVALILRS